MATARALQADLVPLGIIGTILGLHQLFFNFGIFMGALLGGWLTNLCADVDLTILGVSIIGYSIPFWIAGEPGLTAMAIFASYVREKNESI